MTRVCDLTNISSPADGLALTTAGKIIFGRVRSSCLSPSRRVLRRKAGRALSSPSQKESRAVTAQRHGFAAVALYGPSHAAQLAESQPAQQQDATGRPKACQVSITGVSTSRSALNLRLKRLVDVDREAASCLQSTV